MIGPLLVLSVHRSGGSAYVVLGDAQWPFGKSVEAHVVRGAGGWYVPSIGTRSHNGRPSVLAAQIEALLEAVAP